MAIPLHINITRRRVALKRDNDDNWIMKDDIFHQILPHLASHLAHSNELCSAQATCALATLITIFHCAITRILSVHSNWAPGELRQRETKLNQVDGAKLSSDGSF